MAKNIEKLVATAGLVVLAGTAIPSAEAQTQTPPAQSQSASAPSSNAAAPEQQPSFTDWLADDQKRVTAALNKKGISLDDVLGQAGKYIKISGALGGLFGHHTDEKANNLKALATAEAAAQKNADSYNTKLKDMLVAAPPSTVDQFVVAALARYNQAVEDRTTLEPLVEKTLDKGKTSTLPIVTMDDVVPGSLSKETQDDIVRKLAADKVPFGSFTEPAPVVIAPVTPPSAASSAESARDAARDQYYPLVENDIKKKTAAIAKATGKPVTIAALETIVKKARSEVLTLMLDSDSRTAVGEDGKNAALSLPYSPDAKLKVEKYRSDLQALFGGYTDDISSIAALTDATMLRSDKQALGVVPATASPVAPDTHVTRLKNSPPSSGIKK